MLPSEYFRRQVYAMFWFETESLALLPRYQDNVMFETDFPHPTCLYPEPLKNAADNLAGLSPTAREKILGRNAKLLYRLS